MDGSITTNKGIALIGKLLAQKGALQITRVAVGDGTPPASPATLNALVHELKNATIESVDNPKNGEAKIVVTVSSIGVTQGFFVKEIGVFAKDRNSERSEGAGERPGLFGRFFSFSFIISKGRPIGKKNPKIMGILSGFYGSTAGFPGILPGVEETNGDFPLPFCPEK